MVERLHELPGWVIVAYLVLMAVIALVLLRERFRVIRERRAEWLRSRRDLGYSWAWREFWFVPRQRKLPPPRNSE